MPRRVNIRSTAITSQADRTNGAERGMMSDILRFGPEFEVIELPELREAVAQRLARALERYR